MIHAVFSRTREDHQDAKYHIENRHFRKITIENMTKGRYQHGKSQ